MCNKDVNRKTMFEKLRNNGIFVNIHYIPIYRHPFYSKGFSPKDFTKAEMYYSKAISLPIYPDLKKEDIIHVYNVIHQPSNFQNLF